MKELVYSMLTENVGTHFLDSGGQDGRHWQRNRKKSIEDFEAESYLKVNIDKYGVEYSISLFKYLTENFTVNDLCESFNKLDLSIGDLESAEEWLEEYNFKASKEYNTYNNDNSLSQDFQYFLLDDKYVAIAPHLGCDIRGGYGSYKLFKLQDEYLPDVYVEDPDYFSFTAYIDNKQLTETQLEYFQEHFNDKDIYEQLINL